MLKKIHLCLCVCSNYKPDKGEITKIGRNLSLDLQNALMSAKQLGPSSPVNDSLKLQCALECIIANKINSVRWYTKHYSIYFHSKGLKRCQSVNCLVSHVLTQLLTFLVFISDSGPSLLSTQAHFAYYPFHTHTHSHPGATSTAFPIGSWELTAWIWVPTLRASQWMFIYLFIYF